MVTRPQSWDELRKRLDFDGRPAPALLSLVRFVQKRTYALQQTNSSYSMGQQV